MSSVDQCAQLIRESKNIAVLTGAGISTNAGIPDFRGPQGLYVTKRYDADKIFDIGYFYKDQEPFYEFARDFVTLEEKIKPTFTHRFLAGLEEQGKLKGIVTQNIDALHQRAGSKNIFEMHGSIWQSYCLDCDKEFNYDLMKAKIFKENVPRCECSGVIKPDIVFFGEAVKHFDQSAALAAQSDLFFVIGTSCVVYPAAMIPSYAGGKIVVINKGPVEFDSAQVALTVQDDIDEYFKKVAENLEIKL